MIYKVFYQESKVSPRREQTRSLYMEVEAESELQGRIIAREKEHADFSITEF